MFMLCAYGWFIITGVFKTQHRYHNKSQHLAILLTRRVACQESVNIGHFNWTNSWCCRFTGEHSLKTVTQDHEIIKLRSCNNSVPRNMFNHGHFELLYSATTHNLTFGQSMFVWPETSCALTASRGKLKYLDPIGYQQIITHQRCHMSNLLLWHVNQQSTSSN